MPESNFGLEGGIPMGFELGSWHAWGGKLLIRSPDPTLRAACGSLPRDN
jgi:hypothetical protein